MMFAFVPLVRYVKTVCRSRLLHRRMGLIARRFIGGFLDFGKMEKVACCGEPGMAAHGNWESLMEIV
jgi:hypothetical protein